MISLYFNTEDRFCRYGVNHFIEKFGMPVAINESSPSGVVIVYDGNASGDFPISIDKNEIKNTICGTISNSTEIIPLCEIPRDTGQGVEVLAYFESDSLRHPCVTRNEQGIFIGIDIFKETGYMLSGHLDSIRPSLNGFTKNAVALKPCVDFLENILFDAVRAGFCQRQIPLIQKSYWPEGKKFAVCLTHDVDEIKKTYQWISRPINFLMSGDLSGFKDQCISFLQKTKGIEPYLTYDDIIGIEHRFGAKSTYFILKESGNANIFSKKTWYLYGRNRSLQIPEMQALIQRLLANGDEVAVHGSYFSFRDSKLLQDEIQELERFTHEKVIGNRQHNLNLEIPETWNHQVHAGLKYDTTLGFKDSIGFRWGTSFPFYPNTGEKPLPLLEIPLIIMDICIESSKNNEVDCIRIADDIEKYHGVLTLLWHPPIFNTLEYPDARDIYIKLNQHCHDKGAWITRARDIYEWISQRNRQTFAVCHKGSKYSIIPSGPDPEYYFTMYLPTGADCILHSENADIIKKEGDCIYIKTHNRHNNDEIIVGIT